MGEVSEAGDGRRAGLGGLDPVDEQGGNGRGIAVHRRGGGDDRIGSADLVRGHFGDVVDGAAAHRDHHVDGGLCHPRSDLRQGLVVAAGAVAGAPTVALALLRRATQAGGSRPRVLCGHTEAGDRCTGVTQIARAGVVHEILAHPSVAAAFLIAPYCW